MSTLRVLVRGRPFRSAPVIVWRERVDREVVAVCASIRVRRLRRLWDDDLHRYVPGAAIYGVDVFRLEDVAVARAAWRQIGLDAVQAAVDRSGNLPFIGYARAAENEG